MVKALLRRRDRSGPAEADPSANGQGTDNGAGTALLERPPGPGEPPLEAPVQVAPEGATCATCGAPLQDGQEWCLECGTALARNGRRWRVPAIITGVVIAFAITSTAVAFVAISDDGPGTVTVAENPPPVRGAPPAPPPAPPPPPAGARTRGGRAQGEGAQDHPGPPALHGQRTEHEREPLAVDRVAGPDLSDAVVRVEQRVLGLVGLLGVLRLDRHVGVVRLGHVRLVGHRHLRVLRQRHRR